MDYSGDVLSLFPGLTTPVLQAPMAGISTPGLAAAVSHAGGLGALGLGAMDAEAARQAIRDTRRLTDRPFAVNMFCHRSAWPEPGCASRWLDWLRPEFARYGATSPGKLREIYRSFIDNDAMLAMLLDERPALVSFHFGLPTPAALDALRARGIRLAASVTDPTEATLSEAAGLDFLIAQGFEAGGHRGVFVPRPEDRKHDLFALLAILRRATRLPVVAAGGLMTGADAADALRAGACAVQMGTAFVACDESAASPAYRAALASAQPGGTIMVSAISGRPARCLSNRFTALDVRADRPVVPPYPYTYDAGKALDAAARHGGETGYGAFWAGTGASRSRAMPASELMQTLTRELAWKSGMA